MSQKTIELCNCHDQPVPLISTFAFTGAEYWCPACGEIYGMFETSRKEPLTEELQELKDKWEKKSDEFLTAKSRLSCSRLEWEGKVIKPSELPEEEIRRCRKVVSSWVYEIRI